MRFYSTVDLVNSLECEKRDGKAGRLAVSLMRMDLVILDELGYLPCLTYARSRTYEHAIPGYSTMLESLKNAVAKALEKKRRLGQYAVIWSDDKPVILGDDAPKDRMPQG